MQSSVSTSTIDFEVRAYVYDMAMRTGKIPLIAEIASSLALTPDQVRLSLERLAEAHVLVLQRGSSEILMASPFSAVPTPFLVQAGDQEYYGNCIWDALGIPAMLKQDATLQASCACCGTALELRIAGGELQAPQGLVHFAVPAAAWWQDVVFT